MKKAINRKVLPVVYPTVTSWPWHAALLSILETKEETKPWIYSNYIKLVGGMDDEVISFDFLPNVIDFAICPWIKVQLFSRDFLEKIYNNIKDFFLKAIDAGSYIFTVINTEYAYFDVNGKNRGRFPHEMLIYGYDLELNKFYVGDFTFKGKYSYETVDIDCIIRGYCDIRSDEDYIAHRREGIFLLMLNENTQYKFDIALVKYYLENYLQGGGLDFITHIIITDNSKMNCGGVEKLGIDTYELLDRYLELVYEEKRELDIRVAHILYDHKKLMLERLNYMYKNGCFPDTDIIKDAQSICDLALRLRNMFLKCSVKNCNSVLQLREGYRELCQKEKRLYRTVLQYI